MSEELQVVGILTPLVKLGAGKVHVKFRDGTGQERALVAHSPLLQDLVEFEEEFGLFEDACHAGNPARLRALRRLVWLVFHQYQSDLTEAEVGRMFTLSDFEEGAGDEPDGVAIQLINLALTGKQEGLSPKAPAAAPAEAPPPTGPSPSPA